MEQTKLIVKQVVDAWDPMELLATHCPQHEYDAESYRIASCIVEGTTEEMLGSIIKNVFMESFDRELPNADCEEAAAKILEQVEL